MEAKSNKLSASEFESLKRFAIAWLAFYNFAPPETMLRLFIFYRRLIVSLERVQASVSTITITQAPTINRFHSQMVANIQNSRSMTR